MLSINIGSGQLNKTRADGLVLSFHYRELKFVSPQKATIYKGISFDL